jgi:hypothetical protein
MNSSLKPIDKKSAVELYNRDRFIEELNMKILEHNAEKVDTKLRRMKEKDQ